MFFANFVLRPSVALLEPPQRIALLAQVFRRFLAWAGAAIAAIAASGVYLLVALGGMRSVGSSVHLMIAIGVLMMIVYTWIMCVPYRRFRSAIAASDPPAAAAALAKLRFWVAVNLGLGLLTIGIAVLGR